jgi:hypothetical protein
MPLSRRKSRRNADWDSSRWIDLLAINIERNRNGKISLHLACAHRALLTAQHETTAEDLEQAFTSCSAPDTTSGN